MDIDHLPSQGTHHNKHNFPVYITTPWPWTISLPGHQTVLLKSTYLLFFPFSKLDHFFLAHNKISYESSKMFSSPPPSTYVAWISGCISHTWFEVSFLLLAESASVLSVLIQWVTLISGVGGRDNIKHWGDWQASLRIYMYSNRYMRVKQSGSIIVSLYHCPLLAAVLHLS